MGLDYMEDRLREAQDLLRAVLLFHSGGQWTVPKSDEWFNTVQHPDATTKTLCNAIRAHLQGRQITADIHNTPA